MSVLLAPFLLAPLASGAAGTVCGRCGQNSRQSVVTETLHNARLRPYDEQLRSRRAELRGGLVAPAGLTYRRGVASDAALIARRVLRESMNPLFLDPSNFEVACRGDEVVAFGQLRPLPSAGDDDDAGAAAPAAAELASLVVEEKERGRGIGSEIVRRLLERHRAVSAEPVWLLTLASRRKFYAPLGFSEVGGFGVPTGLAAEAAVGSIVARLAAGQGLICMRLEDTAEPEVSSS